MLLVISRLPGPKVVASGLFPDGLDDGVTQLPVIRAAPQQRFLWMLSC